MEYLFVSNGKTELVLVPKSELDRLLLNKLFEQGEVTVEKISQPIGILGKSVQDSFVIRKKQPADDTDKA